VETILNLPGTTLEEEFARRNAAIDAVAAYCKFEEGGSPRGRKSTKKANPPPSLDVDLQAVAAQAEEDALKVAKLSVFTEERPRICFVCLGRTGLEFARRVYKFASPGDLTKHFKRKHLAHIKEGDRLRCKVYLQNHAESIHGTVS
jgi:hypothetical protein